MSGGRAIAALALLWCGTARAPGQNTSQAYGRILDASDAGVGNAAVSVINQDTGFRRIVESQPDGSYVVGSLQPGLYKITVRKEGFRTLIRFGLRLETRQSARADFSLSVGSMQETITVEGTAPENDQDDAAVGTRVPREEIEQLPLNGRGVLSLLELAPGANVTPATRGEAGQFTVNGQRPNTHYFTVDGISANTGISAGGLPAQPTAGALPGMSAFGSLDALLPIEAMQELRVLTSTTAPEYGRMAGASVALSSRSGSNQFHGTTLFRVRHELLSATDWFAQRLGAGRQPLRVEDVSQTLGGPLRRDRTFVFVSYQRMALRQPYAWSQPVPSLEARTDMPSWITPVLNLFPKPNGAPLSANIGEWTGHNNRPAGLHAGGIRVDHALTSRVSVFSRFSDSPSSNEFGNTQVNRLDLTARSVTLGVNARPSATISLDFRVNASDSSAHSLWLQGDSPGSPSCDLQPLTRFLLNSVTSCDYLVRFFIGGVGQLVSGREGDRSQRQLQLVQMASLTRAGHALRLGVDYRRIAPARNDPTGTLSVIADSVDSLSDMRQLWISRSQPQTGSTVVKEFSAWAQDTWQVSPRLAITGGLRWEFSPAPNSTAPAFFLDAAKGAVSTGDLPIWPLTYTNFAPRLGAAWRLSGSGHTVLRAGAGLYYDSSVSVATDMINGGPLSVSQYGSARRAPFSMLLGFAFVPNLRLPQVWQWSASLDHAISQHDVLSIGYVGSAGRRLIRREMGGLGSTEVAWIAVATNNAASGYNGLQVQYRRRMARGFQAHVAYAWSHSIDNDSSDSSILWAGAGSPPPRDFGSSDFDLRHSLIAGLTYEVPHSKGWSLDGIFRARSGFPITVQNAEQYIGIAFANAFRPNLVWGQPVWVDDVSAPGGRRLNPGAFQATAATVQGSLGRNAIAGFGMSQVDLAVRREFKVGERRTLQFRLEAFNALNHPNFADPQKFLNSAIFGRSASMLNLMLGTGSPGSGLAPILQTGGARSLQAVLRFQF